jgi:short subunit dehydrogenase-like uncharacterized protein
LFSAPITAELIHTLPEGPGPQDRAARRWTIVVDAVAADGRRARGVIQGPDTYGTTAVIAVEGARRLATDGAPGGVLAAAQAFGPAGFLDALAPHGITWSIQEPS